MNVSKLQRNTFYKAVDNFCVFNGMFWLDPVEGSIITVKIMAIIDC